MDLVIFEPHTVRTGKGHKNVKKQLREAITSEKGASGIEQAKRSIRGRTVRIDVLFRLWKAPSNMTNTRAQKDLDNLLKPILDVLQTNLNAQSTERGLDLIENDDSVYEINAKKELVDSEDEEGIRVIIFGL